MASELVGLEITGKPFAEAVSYLRGKAAITSGHWWELWKEQHARAFTVAGATRDALLADFFTAVDQAISQGTTLEQFRKDFDSMVSRHGWSYHGSRNWRSRLIYNVNIQTAYQAGRYQQLQRIKDAAPYWEYSSRRDGRVRPQHRAWNGIILRADDPWWNTHYPPNGWNCRCRVWPRTERDLAKRGRTGPDAAPDDGAYEWTNKATGEVHQVPVGIDPGWDYNVGKVVFGERMDSGALQAWKLNPDKWQRLTPGDWRSNGRPERVPADAPKASVGPLYQTMEEAKQGLASVLGGSRRNFAVPSGTGEAGKVAVNVEALAEHIGADPGRTPFLPFIPEALENPYEVWRAFERHAGSGKVALRQRVIKRIELEKDKAILLVAESSGGMFETLTMIPTGDIKYVNRFRAGKLVYGRDDE